jgi:hypothetical protein
MGLDREHAILNSVHQRDDFMKKLDHALRDRVNPLLAALLHTEFVRIDGFGLMRHPSSLRSRGLSGRQTIHATPQLKTGSGGSYVRGLVEG